jgi:hypothetical protein
MGRPLFFRVLMFCAHLQNRTGNRGRNDSGYPAVRDRSERASKGMPLLSFSTPVFMFVIVYNSSVTIQAVFVSVRKSW